MRLRLNFFHLFLLCGFFGGCALVKAPNDIHQADIPYACSENSLRIMSFNIRYHNPDDGENAWPARKDLVASTIRFHKTDIAGLQEALADQVADLAQRLPEYRWLGVGRDDGAQKGEYAAIFYRTDRFKLLDHGTFWLSETPEIKGSRGWDAACVRIATWARFNDKKTGIKFYVFNTHFDHIGEQARIKSAELLLNRIQQLAGSTPVLVSGDFNSLETGPAYQLLTMGVMSPESSLKLADARYRSHYQHHGPDWTFHGFRDDLERAKIDYIFVNDRVRVLQHGFITDKWNSRYPSDHLPVLAEVCLR